MASSKSSTAKALQEKYLKELQNKSVTTQTKVVVKDGKEIIKVVPIDYVIVKTALTSGDFADYIRNGRGNNITWKNKKDNEKERD